MDRPGPMRRAFDWLWGHEDAAGLTAFRFLLGMILTWDILRFLAADWVSSMFLEPEFLFKYWGFTWVQPLPPVLHYAVFYLLLLCGLGIAFGYRFRLCATLFFFGHAYIYLLSASHYLNHAYLICLVTLMLIALPMDRALSRRAKKEPGYGWHSMPRWPRAAILAEVGIVYTYGGIAKINTDWLVYHVPVRRWLANSARDAPFGQELITSEWFVSLISYGGCIYDLLIFPALLWRKTRPIAILLSAGFHLTNAFLFNIGVFPWLMLAITTLFFEPSWPRRLPFIGAWIGRSIDRGGPPVKPPADHRRALVMALAGWFAVQIALPLRHHLYPGNVAWTEQGHRYSWRMKLRSKRGKVRYRVVDRQSDRRWNENPREHLTKRQYRKLQGRPDFFIQYAHFLQEKYRREGHEVAVFVDAWVSLNYRARQRMVDPDMDLTQARMQLAPYKWILPMTPVPPPTD